MNGERVDIVISTYARGDMIDGTVADIRRNSHANFTLWVLDQSEDDYTERCVLRHAAEDARVIYRRAPLRGLTATRNYGTNLGTAPYILFTNDDCRVAVDWIEKLVAELTHPETWMVFGRVLRGERPAMAGAPQSDEVVVAVKPSEEREVYRGHRFNLGFGHGHNMGVRRERFIQLGGFDEFLSGGPLGAWDERDIGYRVLRLGGTIVYSPEPVVYHCHWQKWEGVQRSYRNYGIGAGASVAKYMRSGDTAAIYLLLEWALSQGVRQVVSGIFKWRKWGKILIGLSQIFYPWVGLLRGLRHPFDAKRVLYQRG